MTGLDTARGALRELARAAWPEPGDAGLPPPIRGFVASPFAPLVAAVAGRCLRRRTGAGPAGPTAVVLVSVYADQATAAAVVAEVDGGRRVSPMYFFQSVPNSVLGHVATEWALTGPVVCLSPAGDPLGEGRAVAEGLFADGDAAEALVIIVEHGVDPAKPSGATAVLLRPDHQTTRPPTGGGQGG
ncbi:beta-ketoacyl synthase chain length factor [Micromonospora sp. NPDC005413]|uniref:beta-ketoacyl synthase chain length factor n=1 Tax=Micromonospora sp. NPDC005413 TaxID=3154563 RepID=UPI0033AC2BF7